MKYTFRDNFLKIVESRGLSIAEVGRMSGVPRTTLSDFKNKPHQDISLTRATKIARALGVTLDSMVNE